MKNSKFAKTGCLISMFAFLVALFLKIISGEFSIQGSKELILALILSIVFYFLFRILDKN